MILQKMEGINQDQHHIYRNQYQNAEKGIGNQMDGISRSECEILHEIIERGSGIRLAIGTNKETLEMIG